MKEIKLNNSDLVAIVDDEDYDKVKDFNWRYSSGYAVTDRDIFMHSLIIGFGTKDHKADHKNRLSLDNRRENLRWATSSQNGANRRKQKNNSSGYRGVGFYRASVIAKPWFVRIKVEGKYKCLGYYATKEEAAKIYDLAAKQYFGEFAVLNFP